MPRVDVGSFTPGNFDDNSQNDYRNPRSVLRNTVRVKTNEYAVVRFIGDDGDLSRYHNIPGISQNGSRYTDYIYCSRQNISDRGVPVLDRPCDHCTSADPAISNTTQRFLTWVFHYGTFHVQQNPRYDPQGTQDWQKVVWDEVRRGQKVFFRETIRKPQLWSASFTTYKILEGKRELMDSLTERNFDYGRIEVSGRTQYTVDYSDTQLSNDFSSEIASIQNDLPDVELIAAKLITELDLPEFSDIKGEYKMNSEQIQQQAKDDDDAFENMQGEGGR